MMRPGLNITYDTFDLLITKKRRKKRKKNTNRQAV